MAWSKAKAMSRSLSGLACPLAQDPKTMAKRKPTTALRACLICGNCVMAEMADMTAALPAPWPGGFGAVTSIGAGGVDMASFCHTDWGR
jgi:hypothetical protein